MGSVAAELQFSGCGSFLIHKGEKRCSHAVRQATSRGRSWRIGPTEGIGSRQRGGANGIGSSSSLSAARERFTGIGCAEVRRKTVGQARRVGAGAMAVQMLWGKTEAPKPTSVALEPIPSEARFNEVMREAEEREQAVIVDWLASWCRKCIYLKPKLEKLAAEYHPDIKFYSVDVNSVSGALVKRANVTKMPTIQLWKGGQHVAEVIGGHQAWLVMDEVREMIALKN